MLVQAQVVALGKRGDRQSSPSRFHPVTSITHRQEDRRVRLQNRVDSGTARRATRTLSRNEKFEFFWCPSQEGRSVRKITSREYTEIPPEESARQIPACSRLPGTESPLEIWSADRTAPEQVWQDPGLRELRFAESQPILPPNRNRKPSHEPTHLVRTAPILAQRRAVALGKRGTRRA